MSAADEVNGQDGWFPGLKLDQKILGEKNNQVIIKNFQDEENKELL